MLDIILTVVISALGGAGLTILFLAMRSSGLLVAWQPPPYTPQLFPSEPMDVLREETLLRQAAERHDQFAECVRENEALRAQLATAEQCYKETIGKCEEERSEAISRAEHAGQDRERLRVLVQAAIDWGINGDKGYDAQIARQTKAGLAEALQAAKGAAE